ncbi:hypothetical protein AAHE18_07G172100 [Arachis hypogaea]
MERPRREIPSEASGRDSRRRGRTERIKQLFVTEEHRADEQLFETEQPFAMASPRALRPSRDVEEKRVKWTFERRRQHDTLCHTRWRCHPLPGKDTDDEFQVVVMKRILGLGIWLGLCEKRGRGLFA